MPSQLNDLSQAVNAGQSVATIQEFTYKVISLSSGTAKDVSGSRCILRGVIINTSPAAAVTIRDGSTTVATIGAGALTGFFPLGDVGLRTNCNLTHTAGAGDLTFVFKSF